ncbi:MAG: hypothetical protein KC925_02135 [Candidatus Doudnabacteria bacterium]|nr:hypothetical protein [Candidatus Doudnabacteria bacterium]
MQSLHTIQRCTLAILVACIALFGVTALSASPAFAQSTDNPGAQGAPAGGTDNPGAPPAGDQNNAGNGTAANQAGEVNAVRSGVVSLTSPINCGGQACSVPVIIARVINFILSMVGAVAVIMLVYAGIVYMTSAGSETRAASAKRTISYTVLGLVIVFLSLLIVNFTLRIIGAT